MGFRFGLKEGRWLGVGSNGGRGEARIDLAVSDGGGEKGGTIWTLGGFPSGGEFIFVESS